MLPTSSKLSMWRRMSDSKENKLLDDMNLSYFPSMSSLLGSKSISDIWKPLEAQQQLDAPNNDFPKTYLSNDKFASCSPPSSGYTSSLSSSDFSSSPSSLSQSPAKMGFKILCDEKTASFDSLFKSINISDEFSSSIFNTTASSFIPYSQMSSFDLTSTISSPDSSSSDFSAFDSSRSRTIPFDDVRQDFENNGRTKEVDEPFSPSVSSTPMVIRKPQRLQYSNVSDYAYAYHSQASQETLPFIPRSYSVSPPPPKNPPSWSRNKKPRRKFKPNKKSLQDHCVFCKNNGTEERIYRSHTAKDAMGRTLCPILRRYKCQICGQDGDFAHTAKYCPKRPIVTLEDLERMEKNPKVKN